MSRRKRTFHKPDRRDSRYDSSLVGHLISKVMLDGKRSLAERIVYAAIERPAKASKPSILSKSSPAPSRTPSPASK